MEVSFRACCAIIRDTLLLAAFWLKEDDIDYVPQAGVLAQDLAA